MVDFLKIATRSSRKGIVEVYPKFIVGKSSDLMVKGGDFYAVWLEDRGLWSTDEQDVIDLVDRELDAYAKECRGRFDDTIVVRYMWDSESGVIDIWHKYCQKQMRDNFKLLDSKLTFSNQETTKKDYASKRLDYPLEAGDYSNWSQLVSVLYSPEERRKIEWAIGAIVTGESKNVSKFLVFYGKPGTGKSTIIEIIQKMFDGYYCVFQSAALMSGKDFALEPFKNNPLVAIEHDADFSHTEDNTRLNSLVAHEKMVVNEKHKSLYTQKFQCFVISGTNKPVKITDAKSGIIRRLIDVRPTGNKIPFTTYKRLFNAIDSELGHIAWHCKEVFEEDPHYYDNYEPTVMMGESNDFYNFVLDSFTVFKQEDGTTLKAAWELYKRYCEDAKVPYPYSQRVFKSELANYFKTFEERVRVNEDWVRSYYSGFKTDLFEKELTDAATVAKRNEEEKKTEDESVKLIDFGIRPSNFDILCADCPAQYANDEGTPQRKWDNVKTALKELDTTKLHYVKIPEKHIVIDFDIKDESGNKSFEKNLTEASKWPKTYAELSKSGAGIHLHYIYDGDVAKLSRLYADDIEIKIFTGNSSLRRKLTKCSADTINHLGDVLPKRREKPMVNFDAVKNEKALRTIIVKNLNKEYHSATKPSVDFIYKTLEDAYNSGMNYDVSDLYNTVMSFAAGSTHNAQYCIKLVNKMHFRSDEPSAQIGSDDQPIIFLDCEVFPNLLLVNWKKQGEGNKIVRMINPSSKEIENILKYRIVGYNNRRYDNHILYARFIGYDNAQLYDLSQNIINAKSKLNGGMFQEAYNLSYTDIYDYASKKQSLKKWEIDLGLHHQELGLPWDQPVPESKWAMVSAYCDNDVISTEAVWNATQEDFEAREILATIANTLCPSIHSTVNDTTNQLTGRIIFRGNKKPQDQFIYTNLATGERSDGTQDKCFFPGYSYELGVSKFMDEEVGEGGYVWAKPGMYSNVITFDVASMHPHSIIALNLFGDQYTQNFKDLVDVRISVKHHDWDAAKEMMGGALKPFISEDITNVKAKKLAYALKIAINSVYGLTSAHFPNLFKDPRNIDNIVAKRGALFMCQLKHAVLAMGGEVVHIKTDSIKVANPSEEVKNYILEQGKKFGYTFEVESVYERFCLVNNAVYIARTGGDMENDDHAFEWTATGAQFQVPYVFKKCFTHEPIDIKDLCETKEVKSAMCLDMNEGLPEGEHAYKFIGRVGLFCPIKPGCGGGELVRESKKKDGSTGYDAVTGTKGYRWLESEEVIKNKKEDDIDTSYYDALVNDAIDTISTFGDYEWFANPTN
jgi:hypothetical protein